MARRLSFHSVLLSLLFLTGVNYVHAQAPLPTPSEQEAAVRDYFADIPAMIDVAACESGLRQYTDSGAVLFGGAGGQYIGVFQLHTSHADAAEKLGLDIMTLDGNLAYARHLYEAQGLTPWVACAPKSETPQAHEVSAPRRAELEAKIRELMREIYLLRIKILEIRIEELKALS